jgi:hypothetical protein
MDIIELIKSYASVQRELCIALGYDVSADKRLGFLPKKGSVTLRGELWTYQKHGTGVCFKNTISGAEVDASEHLESPSAFDAWRLEAYCISIKLKHIRYGAEKHRTSGREINSLLKILMENGVLVSSASSVRLVELA